MQQEFLKKIYRNCNKPWVNVVKYAALYPKMKVELAK